MHPDKPGMGLQNSQSEGENNERSPLHNECVLIV